MLQSLPSSALAAADALPMAPGRSKAAQIAAAAALIQPHLARGRPVTAETLGSSMETAFGGSDAEGAWLWRDAYEACEVAQILFLRRYGDAMRRQATSPAAMLAMLDRVATLLPTQTKRSEESQRFQQFSTRLRPPSPAASCAVSSGAVRAPRKRGARTRPDAVAQTRPEQELTMLGHLLVRSEATRVRIWAEGVPYGLKDQLKRRGYRWDGGGDGRPRAWWVEVDEALAEAEIAYLEGEIYMRRVRPRAQRITACERYKAL